MRAQHSQLYEQTIMIDDIMNVISNHLNWCENEARNAAIEGDDNDYKMLLAAEQELDEAYLKLMRAAEKIEKADQLFAFPF